MTALKDELFKLKPMEQITDSQVSQKSIYLSESIRNWIDKEISACEERGVDLSAVKNMATPQKLKKILRSRPLSLECYIEAEIHEILQNTLFKHDAEYFGLEQREENFITEVTYNLRKLIPCRGKLVRIMHITLQILAKIDEETVYHWHSETIKAMATVPQIRKNRVSLLEGLTRYLLSSIKQTFPFIRANAENLPSVYEDIVGPAADLEAIIRISTHRYSFRYAQWTERPKFRPFLSMPIVEDLVCIDTRTTEKLNPSTPIPTNSEGYIGKIICFIQPSLCRETMDSHQIICQGRISVELFGNPERQTVNSAQ